MTTDESGAGAGSSAPQEPVSGTLETSGGSGTLATSATSGTPESSDTSATSIGAGSPEQVARPAQGSSAERGSASVGSQASPPGAGHEHAVGRPSERGAPAVASSPRTGEGSAGTAVLSGARGSPAGRLISLALTLLVGIVLGARCGGCRDGDGGEAQRGAEPGHEHRVDASPAQIWTCSMHPQIRMQEAGSCPICGMDLIPAAGKERGDGDPEDEHLGRVTLSRRAQALAAVQTEPVLRTESRAEIRLLGRVDHDESRLRTVTSWTAGRIDRLLVRATGTRIGKGRVVAKLYSPEIYTATRELALASKQARAMRGGSGGTGKFSASTLEATRTRLRLLGVTDAVLAEIERSGEAPKSVDIRSPYGGTVLERHVEEGQYVAAGAAFFSIADLSEVWVQIDAYESDLPYLSVGQEVELTVEAVPGEVFVGKVGFIDPVLDKRNRTARVRVEVSNRDGLLSPGMFASAVIFAGEERGTAQLVVASSAPLFTGRRSVVYVEVPGESRPTYELREIRVGPKAGPVYPVLSGLREGERVVTRGAFLLDADLQLSGGRSMMTLADDRSPEDEPVLPVTPAFLETIAPVMIAYLEGQERFVADDLVGAQEALSRLAEAVNEIEPPGARPVREAWRETASVLSGNARKAASAETLGASRSAFEQVSLAAQGVLERFGNPTDETLRVAFCPMAFDSRGARWIQRDEAVQNPYYGDAMLRCGEFRASVQPGERAPVTNDDAAGPEAASANAGAPRP